MADDKDGLVNAAHKVEDAKHFFTRQDMNWANYDTYRPKYPDSMWETWMKYHESHGGLTSGAHDIGSGPGLTARELSKFFSHVYVSDPEESSIAAARQLLKPSAKFTFCQTPAEIPWLEDASVDLSSICMAIHWMNSDTALRSVAKSLRPGGTLAICAYSFMPNFPDSPSLEKLWSETVKSAVGFAVNNHLVGSTEIRGMRNYMMGLDTTEIPDDLFTDVLRLQINMRADRINHFNFFPNSLFELPRSQIKEREMVQHVDDGGWRIETDSDWLQCYLVNSNMRFNEKIWEMPSWREFVRIISEEFMGRVVVEWPVSMILATRRA